MRTSVIIRHADYSKPFSDCTFLFTFSFQKRCCIVTIILDMQLAYVGDQSAAAHAMQLKELKQKLSSKSCLSLRVAFCTDKYAYYMTFESRYVFWRLERYNVWVSVIVTVIFFKVLRIKKAGLWPINELCKSHFYFHATTFFVYRVPSTRCFCTTPSIFI